MLIDFRGANEKVSFVHMGFSRLIKGVDFTLEDNQVILNGTYLNGETPLFEAAPIYILYKN